MKQDKAGQCILGALSDFNALKDNILQSFYDRDFSTTIMLADKLESMLDILGEDLCEQECFGLVANAVANAALEVIKATNAQAQSKITKQVIKYAKIAKQAQTRETKAQNQMQFFDWKLALAYASNGDINEAKEILTTLAKPYLSNTYADFSDEANIAYGGGAIIAKIIAR